MNTADPDAVYPTLDEARRALATGTGKGVKIAIIDSGVEVSHHGLKGLALADESVSKLTADKW